MPGRAGADDARVEYEPEQRALGVSTASARIPVVDSSDERANPRPAMLPRGLRLGANAGAAAGGFAAARQRAAGKTRFAIPRYASARGRVRLPDQFLRH